MYVHTGLGQQQVQTQTVTTQRVVYAQPMVGAPVMYYTPGMTYAPRTSTGQPGQLYSQQINPEDLEKAVYKDLPQEATAETEITGTEPQKVYKLKSGLEVPAYILQRDIARKKAERNKAILAANVPPPKYHKIGIFATQSPAKAALYALGAGYLTGWVASAIL